MEHVLEILYEGASVWIFCMAVALLFYCFSNMDNQHGFVKANIYEQHMIYGTVMD